MDASGSIPDGGSAGRLRVRDILEADDSVIGREVTVKGWVRTLRAQKSLAFVEINDGSCRLGLQAVCDESMDTFGVISDMSTGASVSVRGVIKESPGKGQKFEIKGTEIELVGACEPDFPLQKKRHSLEFLRSIAHLRPRTNTIAAAARIRSVLAFATHEYFQKMGFFYLQSPLITASDCEVSAFDNPP